MASVISWRNADINNSAINPVGAGICETLDPKKAAPRPNRSSQATIYQNRCRIDAQRLQHHLLELTLLGYKPAASSSKPHETITVGAPWRSRWCRCGTRAWPPFAAQRARRGSRGSVRRSPRPVFRIRYRPPSGGPSYWPRRRRQRNADGRGSQEYVNH